MKSKRNIIKNFLPIKKEYRGKDNRSKQIPNKITWILFFISKKENSYVNIMIFIIKIFTKLDNYVLQMIHGPKVNSKILKIINWK